MSIKFDDYAVFDLETTIRCPIGSNKASPHWQDNHIVCGAMTPHERGGVVKPITLYAHGRSFSPVLAVSMVEFLRTKRVIVGQNLAFDLKWIKRYVNIDLSEETLWDTAIAEYVLSGQESIFPSLDFIAAKYGLTLKDSKIKEMWEAGIDTDKIPQKMLMDYCEHDVINTEIIFLRQLKEAQEQGCLDLILVLNDALLATIEMMHNGMHIDKKLVESFITIYKERCFLLEMEFQDSVREAYGFEHINLGSPKQLSALLYGGELVQVERIPDGVYKTGAKMGEKRFKIEKKVITFPRLVNPGTLDIPANGLGFSTDDASLEKIKASGAASDFVDIILDFRSTSKQLTTYFEKTNSLLFPTEYNTIYHNINTTATITGRYSSSEPNLQNITAGEKSDIKKCYTSRYGKDGYIVELDFEQLEMVALAQLSGDAQLIHDIENGIDIHAMLYRSLFHRDPTKEERRQFKRASFALIYGAGPRKIAKTVGITEAVAKDFIKAWQKRYPQTVVYWDQVSNAADALRVPSARKDPEGRPQGVAKFRMPTGRILTFVEHFTTWKGMSFSPNETKNYPVQSFATGDLVPLFLGKLYRVLLSRVQQEEFKGLCKLVNTVHDSVILDCHKSVFPNLKIVLKNVSDNLNTHIKKEFNIDMKLKLKTKVSYGPSWFDQKEIEDGD